MVRRFLLSACRFLAWVRCLFRERVGFADALKDALRRAGWRLPRANQSIWVHGEGIGEFQSVLPLLARLRVQHPRTRLVLTTSRPAVRRWLQSRVPDTLCLPHPADSARVARRFFDALRPRCLLLLDFCEGFSLSMLERAAREGIPGFVVNARVLPTNKPMRYRLSDRLGLTDLSRSLVDVFFARSPMDAKALADLGVSEEKITLVGDLKYDFAMSSAQRQIADELRDWWGLSEDTHIVVAGCVHLEEVPRLVAVFEFIRHHRPGTRFVLAPHDVAQAGRIETMFSGWNVSRRSRIRCSTLSPALTDGSITCRPFGARDDDSARPRARTHEEGQTTLPRALEGRHVIDPSVRAGTRGHPGPGFEADLLLVDTVGELPACYLLGDVALVGGSFVPGMVGHSLVEPAVAGCPIVVGVHTDSNRHTVAAFDNADAVTVVENHNLATTILDLLANPQRRSTLAERATCLVERSRGATQRVADAVASRFVETDGKSNTEPRSSGLLGLMASWRFASSRFASWDVLADELGRPEAILCLGNGPSSEDGRLAGLEFDRLFRVNSRWKGRGFLTRPDVVFTGDTGCARECTDSILGFRTIDEERAILSRLVLGRASIRHFTFERVSEVLDPKRWGTRPTNGAVMIATAVALRPSRLVVAGIDLFRHPDGRYPGDSESINRYSPAHDPEAELALLRELLADFPGELVVFGELRSALDLQRMGRR